MQESLLDVMSECIPYMRTNLKNATGVKGMRVNNESDYSVELLVGALVGFENGKIRLDSKDN